METTRVGLFGLGYWGAKYLRLLQEIESVHLVFVVDADRGRLRGLSLPPGTSSYSDADEALGAENIDAAVVVTPASTHRDLVVKCLARSLDVLVEKPLTLSLKDGIDLARQARRAGRLLYPGHVYAHNDGVKALARAVAARDFGQIRYVSCMRTGLGPIRGDTNALWDLVPHDLTILSVIGMGRPESVVAVGRSFLRPGIEDVAFATLLYPNGRLANIQASWLDPYKTRRITAVGSRQMVSFDDSSIEERIKIYERGVDLVPTDAFGEFKAQIRTGDVHVPFVAAKEPLRNLVEAFLQARARAKGADRELAQAIEIVAELEAMHQSMKAQGARKTVRWSVVDAL